jgi:hypothetical protein
MPLLRHHCLDLEEATLTLEVHLVELLLVVQEAHHNSQNMEA